MNVFLCTTYGKNLYCFRQSGQFQQLELKYMAIDLAEVYICLLVWKGGNSCGILTGLLLNIQKQSNAMKSDSIKGFTKLFLLSSAQHYLHSVFFSWRSSSHDLALVNLNQPLFLFVNYPSNTISPVDWYHLLDWKLDDAKKQDWVRAGEGIMFTVYGKQMSQYFREPPAAVEILPLNVNSHQQGNERIKLKLAKNTLKVSLVMEKSPGGTVLYPS